jgi:hypothetical protein
MKINRPTIAQVESAPIGSTLELTRNREQGTPELWKKGERNLWHCSNKGVYPRFSQGLALTTYAKTTLTIELGE